MKGSFPLGDPRDSSRRHGTWRPQRPTRLLPRGSSVTVRSKCLPGLFGRWKFSKHLLVMYGLFSVVRSVWSIGSTEQSRGTSRNPAVFWACGLACSLAIWIERQATPVVNGFCCVTLTAPGLIGHEATPWFPTRAYTSVPMPVSVRIRPFATGHRGSQIRYTDFLHVVHRVTFTQIEQLVTIVTSI